MSDLESSSASEGEVSNNSSGSNDQYEFAGEYLPYQDEPLATSESDESENGAESEDEDGLSADVLGRRYEKEIRFDEW